MSNFRKMCSSTDLVKVCDDRHIMGETDKAILVRVGQTLYGEPITTFYPKSQCRIKYRANGSYEVYVPKWCNRVRNCRVGDFEVSVYPDYDPLPF